MFGRHAQEDLISRFVHHEKKSGVQPAYQTRAQTMRLSRSDNISGSGHGEAEKSYSQHKSGLAMADKPAYWRVVVECLHIAGLGQPGKGSLYSEDGSLVGVELRLFGQTLRTNFEPATPPITLVDSYNQLYVKARQSNLRRWQATL
jgi:hypothetical protein